VIDVAGDEDLLQIFPEEPLEFPGNLRVLVVEAMSPGIEKKTSLFQGDAIAPDPIAGFIKGKGYSLFPGVITHRQAGWPPSQNGDMRWST
jgi:hypothetical protein